MAVADNGWESQVSSNLVQATYAYLSSGENQLSFHEGDTIAITGEPRTTVLTQPAVLKMANRVFGARSGRMCVVVKGARIFILITRVSYVKSWKSHQ